MDGTLSDIQRLPVFADVIVEINHDLNISLSIRNAEKLKVSGVVQAVGGQHCVGIDIEKYMKNRVRGRYRLDFAIGKQLGHLLFHVFPLGVVGFIPTKIIHQKEAAAIQEFSKIFDICRKKVEETRFRHVDERKFEKLFAVDI